MSGAHVERGPLEIAVGERCRRMRVRRGLGLKQVAPLLGLDQGALSRMERGERPISRQMVRDLARLYGCSAFHLEFGVPELVYVLRRNAEMADVELVAAFSDPTVADEWATTAALAEPDCTYTVEALGLDDTETMRLFAEERLASRATREVAA